MDFLSRGHMLADVSASIGSLDIVFGDCGTMAPGAGAAEAGMTKEAALLLFNSVHVTVSTICRIGFVCAQARIETE